MHTQPMTVSTYRDGKIVQVPMSKDQEYVVNEIIDGDAQIYRLCGGAGCGKSAVIEYLAEKLDAAVCATTARAAINVSGCTVDSLFAFKRKFWGVNRGLQERNMEECSSWIIIDESSMIGTGMANIIHDAIVDHNKRVVLVGDWAQAPPVKDNWPINHPLMEEGISLKLTTNHRQGQGLYLDCLKEIREGVVSTHTNQVFGQRRVEQLPQDDLYTYMYGTNRAAEAHNEVRFKVLLEQSRCPPVRSAASYNAIDEFAPSADDQIEKILTDSRLSHGTRYCVGARVMTTINNYQCGFVNGDIGHVTGYFTSHDDMVDQQLRDVRDGQTIARNTFYQRYDPPIGKFLVGLTVILERTGEEVFVPQMAEEMHKPDGRLSYRITGVPVRLAYALTVHKMQGATLDRAILMMNSLWYEHGLAYVGLSRTKTIEGLLLEAWRPDLIHCDNRVHKYL